MKTAEANGRNIPMEDMIFGISRRAAEAIEIDGAEQVINGVVGAMMDDDGRFMVLSSVDRVFRALSPEEYAPYAPISGTPAFKEAAIKAALKNYSPQGHVRAVATPGGTGALRTAVANYTCPGDKILTTDWHWAPYGNIAAEQGRGIDTFVILNDERKFNLSSFETKVKDLLTQQDRLLIILNTPAQNPTGYSLTHEDWEGVRDILSGIDPEKKIALVADTAYIDFAGDEDEYRSFYRYLDDMQKNIFPMIAFSLSKTFTLYGLRCGALICMAHTEEEADEFARVCEFSARATWSNSPRAGQSIMEKIFADPALLAKVTEERAEMRELLLERGRAFEEASAECGLEILPYDGGFFASVPCEDPKAAAAELERMNIFLVPLGKGIRVSLASIPADKCRMIPAKIKEVLK